MTRIDDEADRFEQRPVRTGLKWWVVIVALVTAMVVVAGVAGFALNWLGAATDVVSPTNVKEQYAAVIEDWNALEASAENACGAEDAAHSQQGPTLVEDPALAYKAKYRSIAVDYNRRETNIFEANLVGPSNCGARDCPRLAPNLSEMQAQVC